MLRISWTARVSNKEVLRRTDQPLTTTSSVPPVLSSSVTLRVPIHLRTTVEPLGHVWLLCQRTGTADQADRVTPGSGPLNLISHHSTLVWQPPIIECRIVKPGARSSERTATSITGHATWWWWWLLLLTSDYAMVVHGRPKTPKIQVFWGSPSPQGSHSPYILRDTIRPGHVTCALVRSKSDRRRLRKTLHKQTDKQTLRK